MATLIFLLTFLTLAVLAVIVFIKAITRKPVKRLLESIVIIVVLYSAGWLFFYTQHKYIAVALGTEVCFDDWCATVTKVDKGANLPKLPAISKDSTWVILHITMSNHARGIAQKPSEPRIHIIDDNSNYWAYSVKGQQIFEQSDGKQIKLDSKLELYQSLNTALVFKMPANAKNPKILIEEGPFITKLLFPDDELVFALR